MPWWLRYTSKLIIACCFLDLWEMCLLFRLFESLFVSTSKVRQTFNVGNCMCLKQNQQPPKTFQQCKKEMNTHLRSATISFGAENRRENQAAYEVKWRKGILKARGLIIICEVFNLWTDRSCFRVWPLFNYTPPHHTTFIWSRLIKVFYLRILHWRSDGCDGCMELNIL